MPTIKYLSVGLFYDEQKNIFFTKFEDKDKALSVPASKHEKHHCPIDVLGGALISNL